MKDRYIDWLSSWINYPILFLACLWFIVKTGVPAAVLCAFAALLPAIVVSLFYVKGDELFAGPGLAVFWWGFGLLFAGFTLVVVIPAVLEDLEKLFKTLGS